MFVASMSRRTTFLLSGLALLGVVVLLHTSVQSRPNYLSWPSSSAEADTIVLSAEEVATRKRLDKLGAYCAETDPFELAYGRANLRLSRGYEGSRHRLQRVLSKTLRGEAVTISAIGGSVTKGHAVYGNEAWFHRFGQWFHDFIGDLPLTQVNGAAPATGSDYFSFCFPLHIPQDSDLIFVELGINDEGIPEHVENMENLIRGLLDLPQQPAVILVEALAFSNGGMGGGGGRMHLPVAQYYDVPVINQRHPVANHIARYPQLLRHYFAQDWWGNPDTRHLNARGHRDLTMLIASFVRDTACSMMEEPNLLVRQAQHDFHADLGIPDHIARVNAYADFTDKDNVTTVTKWQEEALLSYEAGWPEQTRAWRQNAEKDEVIGQILPGMFMDSSEYGQLPRMRLLEGWNPDLNHATPPFHPTCLSAQSQDPSFNLTPSSNSGWEHWVHPDHKDKPYLLAKTPGAIVTFELQTALGVVKLYSLKSKSFGLGTIECWADDDKAQSVKVEGYWDNGDANIGRFDTIRTDLSPGAHTISCQLLQETADPEGGHEFRMMAIMSV